MVATRTLLVSWALVTFASGCARGRVSLAHRPQCGLRTRGVVTLCAPATVTEPALESECDFDHGPLAAALRGDDLLEADRITREALIKLAGEGAVLRNFVYFTEVKNLPYKDIATIDALWRAYTHDKQGYSIQSKILRSPRVAGDLTTLYKRIGWTNKDGTLRRWTADDGNEFIYSNEEAPTGHLPLTNTLRGTRLLTELMAHPAVVAAAKTAP